jgi:hypothetical protein
MLLLSCGQATSSQSDGDSERSLVISSFSITPNPVTIGQFYTLMFYIEKIVDQANVRELRVETSTGETGSIPVTLDSSWAAPDWVSGSDTAQGPAGTGTITIWLVMNDGTESNRLTISYTAE